MGILIEEFFSEEPIEMVRTIVWDANRNFDLDNIFDVYKSPYNENILVYTTGCSLKLFNLDKEKLINTKSS